MSITMPSTAESTAADAVEFCNLAWQEAFDQHCAKGKDDYSAARYAHKAFRQAMPDLISAQNISAFIACVSRGVLIGAIEQSDAARLLYAAQVARQAVHTQPEPRPKSASRKSVQPEQDAATSPASVQTTA